MKRLLAFAALVCTFAALAPSDAWGQKKKAGAGLASRATPQEYAQLRALRQIAGQISALDANSKIVTLKVDIPEYAGNPNARPGGGRGGNNNQNQQLQRLRQQQQQAQRIQNPAQRRQKLQQLAAQMQRAQMQQQARGGNKGGQNGGLKVVMKSKEFELILDENVVVRKMFLGSDFDDQGNIKKHTPQELAKLRGSDASKPGYKASLEEAQPGMDVTLFLSKATAAPKQKGDDDEVGPGERPLVTMIVLTRDAGGSLSPADAPRKKK